MNKEKRYSKPECQVIEITGGVFYAPPTVRTDSLTRSGNMMMIIQFFK